MVAALLMVLVQSAPTELADYLRAPQSAFKFTAEGDEFRLTSQTWQGVEWKHDLVLVRPARLARSNAAILVATGDRSAQDLPEAKRLADAAGLPVAVLFNVPNQPLFDGKREDGLIAHTFQRYLETADRSWPLLFPMTRSVIAAMDALERHSRGSANPLRRFVVAGASKRGWTAWLAGASEDRRIAGIVPQVFDNLNFAKQLPHQLDLWGRYSPMIGDYTSRNLPDSLATPEGQKLAAMVDPYSYRSLVKVPTLMVHGANDPYWAVDALSLYWSDLSQPKWAVIVPNAGHGAATTEMAEAATAFFARSCVGGAKMPGLKWRLQVGAGGEVRATVEASPRPTRVRIWSASSSSRDFAQSKFGVVATAEGDAIGKEGEIQLVGQVDRKDDLAIVLEMGFSIGGADFSLTAPALLAPKGILRRTGGM